MIKLLNWYVFARTLQEKRILLFSAVEIGRLFGATKTAVNMLLHRYEASGRLIRVKRGLYALREAVMPEPYLANKLYEPSYVSREFALSYHRVIPEVVYELTSVTPKSTRRFEVFGKVFSYRSIQTSAFTGYAMAQQQGARFLMADPEKAWVDAQYFRVLDALPPMTRYDAEKINPHKASAYAQLFRCAKLENIIKRTRP